MYSQGDSCISEKFNTTLYNTFTLYTHIETEQTFVLLYIEPHSQHTETINNA